MDAPSCIEERYYAAKQRLLAAQQEKLEAAAEFMTIRALVNQTLGTLWPSPCPCGEREYEKDVSENWV